ncbi:MAG TPA: hypothetical protein VKR32_03765 [Puia sp.]|nr:hypothetical protein [Puia sp.]
MQKNNMYFDTHKAKIYRDIYRPSSHFSRFFKSIICVILSGRPVVGDPAYHRLRKSR